MPHITVNGAKIYYEEQGSGTETIVFAHGLLWSTRLFDNQVNELKKQYRCISFDFRGQGQSEVTESGYDMDTLSEDAVALIKQLNCAPCHFVGLSMGGFVGMRLGFRYPQLLKSLTLMETSSDPEPSENIGKYKLLNFIARLVGLGPLTSQAMPIMFGKKFLSDPARNDIKKEMKKRIASNNKLGITNATKGVISRAGVYDEIKNIKIPTLIIVGDQDRATIPAKSQRIHSQIQNSQLVIIPGAGHTSTVEEPEAVNNVLIGFLKNHTK